MCQEGQVCLLSSQLVHIQLPSILSRQKLEDDPTCRIAHGGGYRKHEHVGVWGQYFYREICIRLIQPCYLTYLTNNQCISLIMRMMLSLDKALPGSSIWCKERSWSISNKKLVLFEHLVKFYVILPALTVSSSNHAPPVSYRFCPSSLSVLLQLQL